MAASPISLSSGSGYVDNLQIAGHCVGGQGGELSANPSRYTVFKDALYLYLIGGASSERLHGNGAGNILKNDPFCSANTLDRYSVNHEDVTSSAIRLMADGDVALLSSISAQVKLISAPLVENTRSRRGSNFGEAVEVGVGGGNKHAEVLNIVSAKVSSRN